MSVVANLASSPAQQGVALQQVVSIPRPRHKLITAIVLSVLVGAALELAPPLLMRKIVDEHLTVGHAEGLLGLALMYLGASARYRA